MRCKMGDLKAGDVFTFGSPERYTVVSVDGNDLDCSYVDAGGTTQPHRRLIIQKDRHVECFTKSKPAAKPAAKVEKPVVEEPVVEEPVASEASSSSKKRSSK